jgi:NhaP-type Na+/H+ or K+/H+ antiporter
VEELFILAVAVFAFAMVSERLAVSPITAPMVFTTVGLVLGPAGLDWFDLDIGSEAVILLVEATLVLVLFTDAVRIDLRVLRRESWLPKRLLGIGLPLTVVAGTGVAAVVLGDLTIGEAALVAAVLAPTDAALGQAVVSDRRLPVRLRQGLNVESGLNDGIALPVVTVLIAVVGAEIGDDRTGGWLRFALEQVGFGVASGLVIGAAGAVVLRRAAEAGAIEGVFRQLATIAVAVGAYAGASLLDGNGFMAAFVAGLAFGHLAGPECSDVQEFTQDEGELLTVITFGVFGAALAGPLLDDITWEIGLYAVLSLTVVRMVPVLVAMAGTGTTLETRLFAGWFGPRGLASILFALLVSEELSGPGVDTVVTTVVATVLLSVYAHGATASPWATRLAGRLAGMDEDTPEMAPATEMPTRRG